MPRAQVRGARLNSFYRGQWFDPRNGRWQDAGTGLLHANQVGTIELPDYPDDEDWALRLILQAGH